MTDAPHVMALRFLFAHGQRRFFSLSLHHARGEPLSNFLPVGEDGAGHEGEKDEMFLHRGPVLGVEGIGGIGAFEEIMLGDFRFCCSGCDGVGLDALVQAAMTAMAAVVGGDSLRELFVADGCHVFGDWRFRWVGCQSRSGFWKECVCVLLALAYRCMFDFESFFEHTAQHPHKNRTYATARRKEQGKSCNNGRRGEDAEEAVAWIFNM